MIEIMEMVRDNCNPRKVLLEMKKRVLTDAQKLTSQSLIEKMISGMKLIREGMSATVKSLPF